MLTDLDLLRPGGECALLLLLLVMILLLLACFHFDSSIILLLQLVKKSKIRPLDWVLDEARGEAKRGHEVLDWVSSDGALAKGL